MKETIEINPQEVLAVVKQKVDFIEYASDLKIKDNTSFRQASEAMKTVKQAKTFLKEKKDEILKPLDTAVKNIKALFKPSEDKVSAIETYLKEQLGTYNEKLKIEEDKRAKEAEKQIAKGVSMEVATKKLEDTQEKIQAIPTRRVQKIRIIDFSKVPDEFKVLNEQKAKETFKNGIKVDGLEEYFEEIIINKF